MQAPGCTKPYQNGIIIPTYICNPMLQAELKEDWLDGWEAAIKLTTEVAQESRKVPRAAKDEQLSLEHSSAEEDFQVSESSDEETE